jgi:hypothetical protein
LGSLLSRSYVVAVVGAGRARPPRREEEDREEEEPRKR